MPITHDTSTTSKRLTLTPAQFAKALDVGLDQLVADGDIPERVAIPDNVGADLMWLDNDHPQTLGILDMGEIGINVIDETDNLA